VNHGSASTGVRARLAAVLAALTVFPAGCGATGPPVDTTTAPTTTAVAATSTAAASTSVSPQGGLLATDPPHNEVQPFPAAGSCHARQVANGVLPDPTCTPGAIDPHVTDATLESTVCRRGGYTSTVRPPTSVTNSEKRLAQAAYGQSDGPSAYELDHLVPLGLGGTPNSAANIWPQPGPSPNPKDKLEGALHDLLCARRITLTAAQQMIANDWINAYQQILGSPPPG